ncbi:MAG: glutaredoxin family protein [Chloroflexi bacterium]|nr:glutaredoxin family protein [Chloroflexota bacterium]
MGYVNVRILTRAHCCLCDEAKNILERARQKVPFELEVVDIDSDPGLFSRYQEEVPVIFVAGRKAFKYRVTEEELVKKLTLESASMMRKDCVDAHPGARG